MKGRAAGPAQAGPRVALAPRPPQYWHSPSVAGVVGTAVWVLLPSAEGGWVSQHFGLGCKRSCSSSSHSCVMDRASEVRA